MSQTSDEPKAPLVPCPTCRREIAYSARNPWRPFCSERCRRADLGAWASERYRVATPIAPDDDADGPAQ
jgi:uncharacterized protein